MRTEIHETENREAIEKNQRIKKAFSLKKKSVKFTITQEVQQRKKFDRNYQYQERNRVYHLIRGRHQKNNQRILYSTHIHLKTQVKQTLKTLSQPTQNEIDPFNSPISVEETEFIILKTPKVSRPSCFHWKILPNI